MSDQIEKEWGLMSDDARREYLQLQRDKLDSIQAIKKHRNNLMVKASAWLLLWSITCASFLIYVNMPRPEVSAEQLQLKTVEHEQETLRSANELHYDALNKCYESHRECIKNCSVNESGENIHQCATNCNNHSSCAELQTLAPMRLKEVK